MIPPTCPYCEQPSIRTSGRDVYPHRPDLHPLAFYVCTPCDARVGTHPNGAPLGRLANAELRGLRVEAHAAFDPLWRLRRLSRTTAYKWLSQAMGLPEDQTHIGMFDEAQCRQVVEAVQRRTEGRA